MAVLSLLSLLVLIRVITSQNLPDDLSAVFEVEEESPPQSFIGNVAEGAGLQNFLNSSTLLQLEYSFIPEPDNDFIHLEPTTGNLRTQSVINREDICPGQVDCYITVGIGIIKPSELFRVISVQVRIMDINDQTPVFVPSSYNIKFSEADPIGTIRNLPVALDLDSPRYGIKEYRMDSGNPEFELLQVNNPINGMIDLKLSVRMSLDRELRDAYSLRVQAFDAGTPALIGQLMIDVTIEDDNDHSPRFGSDLYEVDITEDYSINNTFFTIHASDSDLGDNSQLSYALSSRTSIMHGHLFAIHQTTGELSLRKALDFESETVYHLEVTATDQGSNPRSGLTTVKVQVLDVNDNVPQITISYLSQKATAEVTENMSAGQITAHVSVYDADSGQNGQVICNMQHPMFELGVLRTNQYKISTTLPLNREDVDRFVLSVQCSDLGSSQLTTKQNLTVIVLDQNDNSPVFRQLSYSGAVPENIPENGYIASVNATDADIGVNAKLTFDLVEQNMTKYVQINPNNGIISAAQQLDYEEIKELRFTVRVTDQGVVPLSAEAAVTIRIMDQNDEAPKFSHLSYLFYVEENQPARTLVGKVEASDLDSSPFNIMEYSLFRQNSLDQALFSIDSSSGYIYTSRSLDHEETSLYYVSVMATDVDNTAFVGTATVTIQVQDVNDNAPIVHFPMENNSTFVISNQVHIGYNITKIFSTDPDSGKNGNVTFTILTGNHDDIFRIDYRRGYLQTNADVSGTTYQEYRLRIQIQDEGTPALSNTVELTVTVDENVPYFSDDVTPPAGGMVQKTNLTIIIVVAAVSGLVIVILVIAIVVLKTADCRHPIFFRKSPPNGDKSAKVFSDLNIKAVEANGYLQQKPGGIPVNQNPGPVSVQQNTGVVPGYQTAKIVPDIESPALLSTDTLRQHKMRKDSDGHSVSSADISNTDSGRGGSEEGDRHASPSKLKYSQPPIHSKHSALSQHHPGYGNYGDHLHGYQHSPRHTASEASYSGSQASHMSHPSNIKQNNLRSNSHQTTPEKPKRDSQNPYMIDANNGAHGYSATSVNPGHKQDSIDPPPYRHGNKPYHPADHTGYHGNNNHGNHHASDQFRSQDNHRNSARNHTKLRPPPARPLKSVNV